MRAQLLIGVLAASTAALAQPAGFAALDRNGDGFLSRVEALADPEISKRFAQFDTNGDRRLSHGEYLSAREHNVRRAHRDATLTARVHQLTRRPHATKRIAPQGGPRWRNW